MVESIAEPIDYLWCKVAGKMHPWLFRRNSKGQGIYHCPACNLKVTKDVLKDKTDDV